MSSDTPRSDAAELWKYVNKRPWIRNGMVHIHIARQLERELNEARAEINKMRPLIEAATRVAGGAGSLEDLREAVSEYNKSKQQSTDSNNATLG